MLRISTKSQYGLRAMVYLSETGEISSLKVIVKKEKIPFDYLEKIMAKLEKGGLVRAKRGKKGGYFLAKPSRKIKIGDIIKTLEGDISLVQCLSETDYYCSHQRICRTKKIWQKLKDSLNSTLNSITLADVSKYEKR